MLIKTIMYCALLGFIVACSVAVAYADELASGWPECDRGTATYDQQECIKKAEHWKGVDAPYRFSINEEEGRILFEWAHSAPGPLSLDTTCGVAGDYLDAELTAVCAPFVATPTATATWTITPTPTPTVSPTATPAPTIVDDPIEYGSPWWLPIVINCNDVDHQYQSCGR